LAALSHSPDDSPNTMKMRVKCSNKIFTEDKLEH
jgi:hypothetical protein